MGVKGLWRLINTCGAPVTLESLEHKVLAVDVSIWLHQAVRGFKGFGNVSGTNAHLLTLFHRICKLLFYKIRPVFVFDGGVPQLKKQTLSSRRLRREAAANKAQKVRDRLFANLLRSQAVRAALGKKGPVPSLYHIPKPVKKEKDLFELPPLNKPLKLDDGKEASTTLGSDSEEEEDFIVKNLKNKNIHDFEYGSKDFESLPLQQQHEILYELQVTRKKNSWHSVNEMPQKSTSFSSFQMDRLLKRKKFQEKLENIQTEIQKKHSSELEAQLFGDLEKHVSQTNRIVSEDAAHSILVKTLKDKAPASSGTLNEVIHEEERKTLKKSEVKKDFLTELAKQGIVSSVSSKSLKRDFESSFSDSEIESDYSSSEEETFSPSRKMRKMEEAAFLKAVDYVLDDNELSQEEIFSLIKQTQTEVDNESGTGGTSKPNSSSKSANRESVQDLDKPSTSMNAPGRKYTGNSDSESSTDDDDFIDVTDFETSDSVEQTASNLECSNDPQSSKLSTTEPETQLESSANNVNAILTAKTDSLYIKILQQKLDDVLVQNETSVRKKSTVDTRKGSPLKGNGESSPNKNNKGVTIDLELISKPVDGSFSDDIFKDVFKPQNKLSKVDKNNHLTFNKKNSSEYNEKSIPDSSPPNSNLTTSEYINKIAKTTIDNASLVNLPDGVEITDQLKEKITELLKLEIDKIIKKSQPEVEKEADVNLHPSDVESFSVPGIHPLEQNFPSTKAKNKILSTNFREKVETVEDKTEGNKLVKFVNEKETDSSNISHASYDDQVSSPEELKNNEYLEPKSDSTQTEELKDNTSLLPVEDVELSSVTKSSEVDEKESSFIGNDILPKYSSDQLEHMESELVQEKDQLIAQAERADRVAVDLSDQVYGDAQQLLRIFGLPYLVAPMEAEAQCAFLDKAGLTHGTITDDSDIFLFGGKIAYKNFFNQSKHVECFKVENILHNIGLDRNKMVSLAMLTGSDYTVGIESVGAVLGMEILSEFPGEGLECLRNFKKWWNVASKSVSSVQLSKTKQRLINIHLPESFPNENIFKAYQNPDVDLSDEKFSWGFPDCEKLRAFAGEKFGWSLSKTDEIIIPVFKKLGIKQSQMHIDSYFSTIRLVKEPHNQSKRLQEAIARSKGKDAEQIPTPNPPIKHSTKKAMLIDPSQGSYSDSKKRGRKKKIESGAVKPKTKQLSNKSSQAAVSDLPKENDDKQQKATTPQKEKQLIIYKKLLEKKRIMQDENNKQKKSTKR